MLTVKRSSRFIKQFDGPGQGSIVCYRFHQAVIASGCPGECAYCFLQNLHPYRSGRYDLKGTLFSNLRDIVPEARRWLKQHDRPAGLIVGENQDGLAFEGSYKDALGVTPLELLIPLFENENPVGHTLIVLSKFTSTQYAEALGPAKNLVFSWSLSLPSVSRKYEQRVASLGARMAKAAVLKTAGYRIRFRLDALCPVVPNWQEELIAIVERINDLHPEMLTIGALRASNVTALRRAAMVNGRDGSVFDHIDAPDPSGFKYRTDRGFHTAAFRLIRETLKSSIPLGLCKEDISMWHAAETPWQGCHCLHGTGDGITAERALLLYQLTKFTRTQSFPE